MIRLVVCLGVALVLTLLAGCASPPRQVSGTELISNATSDPLDCMTYQGSDAEFHYFDRTQFKTTQHFKVRREEVDLPSGLRVGDIPTGIRVRTRPMLQG